MVKANEIKKTEALKLREGGMKLNDIVDKVSLSKATLKRLFKKKGLTNNKLSLSHEPPVKSDLPVISDTKDPESKPVTEKVKLNSEPKGVSEPSFHNLHVTFNDKSGGFTLEPGEKKTIVPETVKPLTLETTKEPVKPGGGQASQIAHVSEKPDVDAPESPLDSIFKRSYAEILIPLGLVVCGYAMGAVMQKY
jgi:hypothetical protein